MGRGEGFAGGSSVDQAITFYRNGKSLWLCWVLCLQLVGPRFQTISIRIDCQYQTFPNLRLTSLRSYTLWTNTTVIQSLGYISRLLPQNRQNELPLNLLVFTSNFVPASHI